MTIVSARSYRLLAWLLPVLIVIVGRDLLWRQATSLYDHAGAIRSYAGRIHKTGIHVRELPEMKNDFERLAEKKMAIAMSLLGEKSEASLYDLLMLKARESGVSIVSVTPRPQRRGSGFIEQPLLLEATGAYNGLARFTGAIENVNRIMRVEDLSLEKDRTGRLTAALRLLVYLYSDTLGGSAKQKSAPESAFANRSGYLADLAAALQVTIPQPSNTYSFDGQADPFGAVAASGNARPAQQAGPSKEQPRIVLKGILWKTPPLAIPGSLDGTTSIVRQGDTVAGFRVSSITRNEVVIASSQGTHVLQQYNP